MIAPTTRLWIAVLFAALVLAGLPAAAEERPIQLLLGVTPGASYSEIDGFDYEQGYTLGLGYFWTSRWAAEIRGTLDGYIRTGSGEDLEAYSLDLASRYYFFTGRKWGAFSALGLRYAKSDFGVPASSGDDSGVGLLFGLGSELSLSKRFSLRMDLNAVPVDFGGYDERLEDLTFGVAFGIRF